MGQCLVPGGRGQWSGCGVWLALTLCSLQLSLLCAPALSLGDGRDSGLSDSEESVFSGLEDSGSDSSADTTAEEENGASGDENHSGMEKTTGQQVRWVSEEPPSGLSH